MPAIRPEVQQVLQRWRAVIAGGAVAVAGLWLGLRGGPLFAVVGVVVTLAGLALALDAFRRLRFAQAVAAPGMVEVNEGQVGYMGPAFGGYVALPDLVEVRLLTMRGRRLWRLKQADGQALLIPVDAAGAETLFDAFASLPGMDTAALVAALAPGGAGTADSTALALGPDTRLVWRRAGRGVTAT